MPFPMKIQPIDAIDVLLSDQVKPVPKWRLKRLFERQFPGVLRISSAERLAGGVDLEPSSVCLDKMVRNFIEDSGEKPSSRCGRSRCNCFHGNCDDSSDDDLEFLPSSNAGDPPVVSAAEVIKGLVVCATLAERNLLADASSVVEKCKNCNRKDEHMKAIADGLRSLGYDAAICKSRWEKTPSFPAGEHEYIDVIVGLERLLVDVDFRSEFEIARSTKSYAALLQSLPSVFVGKVDRVDQIVAVVSEAARHSLKKKGLHFPPWRKPEYLRSKWLAPYERSILPADPMRAAQVAEIAESDGKAKSENGGSGAAAGSAEEPREAEGKGAEVVVAAPAWELPEVKPKASHKGAKVVTGLASVLSEKP
ncbi:uncharacterized protein LOC135632837 [Musa acuminata AAA Group]|uniref:uncharacterized protein LOC135607673 n=1 Tax=Musa acuminata AAA Group TaxID=214697 RepID=UPI0031DB7937